MSTASISYSSLKDASNEAKSVAKKLGKYADSLYDNVYKKLNNYGGTWTSNLTEARSKTSSKINELRSEQSRYNTYASNLIDLRDECKSVDRAVRSKVSSLTASFKETHGIKNSKIENAINYFFTGLGNGTAFGRWLGGKKDDFDSSVNYFKESIKEWYNYDGGKQFIQGVLVGLLECAIAVLAVASAILTGGATLWAVIVLVAGVIGGAIAFVNGVANILNEGAALSASKDDPATGRRRSEVNSVQDYLRSSFKFYDSEYYDPTDEKESAYGKYYSKEGKRNEAIAMGIDIVNLACTVVTVINSAGKLLKNGYKWVTGNAAKVSDIKLKQIFSKDTFTAFKGKFTDIKAAFQARGWASLKNLGGQMLKDIGRNLKGEFWSFDSSKDAVSSIKNMISVPKDLLKDGLTLSNIASIGLKNFALPALTAFTVNSTNGYLATGSDGQMFFDFTDKVTLNDIYGIGDKTKSKIIESPVFSHDSTINIDVLNKFQTPCNIDISIPEINIPNIEMPVLRAA